MPAEVEISYGKEADISAQALVPGPLYVEIVNLMTVQPCGSFKFDNVIQLDEEFDIVMTVLLRDVLRQLQVKYIANLNVLNMETGDKATPYSFKTSDTLDGGDNPIVHIRWKNIKATEKGIFLMSASIGFPTSRLFDFTLGRIAGSEPPIPVKNPLRIANFYVYDRNELP